MTKCGLALPNALCDFVPEIHIRYLSAYLRQKSEFLGLCCDLSALDSRWKDGGSSHERQILQIPRDEFSTQQGISDNNAKSFENTGGRIQEPAVSSTSKLNKLPDDLIDVLQVTDCLHVPKTSIYKLIERQKIPL